MSITYRSPPRDCGIFLFDIFCHISAFIPIVYPIWWGIAAWPVDSFVENNDFTGKTVIPFCTSASSGIGDSGQLLEEMAGTGDWQEGERFRSGADEADVQEWVNGLGL